MSQAQRQIQMVPIGESNIRIRFFVLHSSARSRKTRTSNNEDAAHSRFQMTTANYLHLYHHHSLGRGKFNVDSPSFTPSTPPKNIISPKTVDAAPFTPRGSNGKCYSHLVPLLSCAPSLLSSGPPPMLGTLTPPIQPQFQQDPTNR